VIVIVAAVVAQSLALTGAQALQQETDRQLDALADELKSTREQLLRLQAEYPIERLARESTPDPW
jgi:hypothetical protein